MIYPEGFKRIPQAIKENYKWIEITKREQKALATNVLSISKQTVISRKRKDCKRVNSEIRKIGLDVIEIKFDVAPLTGGSFRCCSLPLQRQ